MPEPHDGRSVSIPAAAVMTDQTGALGKPRSAGELWAARGRTLGVALHWGGKLPRAGNVKLLRRESQARAQTQNVRPNLNGPKFGSGCEICGLGPFLVYI